MTNTPNNVPRNDSGSRSASGTTSDSKKDAAAASGKAEANQLKNEAAGSGQRVKETAKEQVGNVKDEAVQQAKGLVGQLRSGVGDQVRPQQERLASTVRSLSDEIGAISRGDKPETDLVAGLLGNVSGRVDALASSLENKDAQDLLDDVRRFAARRPGAFLVLAGGVGLLAGRVTRGVKDSDEIATDKQGAQQYLGVGGQQEQATRTGGPAGTRSGQGYDRNLTGTETSGYTPADPYAYGSEEQGEAARTHTDRVPGTVYPGQEGNRR